MPGIAKQIHALLTAKERLRFFYLVLAALMMTALELVGIGAIVAFMGVLAQPDLVFENRWLSQLYTTPGFDDAHQFIPIRTRKAGGNDLRDRLHSHDSK